MRRATFPSQSGSDQAGRVIGLGYRTNRHQLQPRACLDRAFLEQLVLFRPRGITDVDELTARIPAKGLEALQSTLAEPTGLRWREKQIRLCLSSI